MQHTLFFSFPHNFPACSSFLSRFMANFISGKCPRMLPIRGRGKLTYTCEVIIPTFEFNYRKTYPIRGSQREMYPIRGRGKCNQQGSELNGSNQRKKETYPIRGRGECIQSEAEENVTNKGQREMYPIRGRGKRIQSEAEGNVSNQRQRET